MYIYKFRKSLYLVCVSFAWLLAALDLRELYMYV